MFFEKVSFLFIFFIKNDKQLYFSEQIIDHKVSFFVAVAHCNFSNEVILLTKKQKGLEIILIKSFNESIFANDVFIALVHPIQWTNAYPVGADRPAKRQKKTSCVSTGRSVRSTSAIARWRVILPFCLDSVRS